jgi:hypothetical protein
MRELERTPETAKLKNLRVTMETSFVRLCGWLLVCGCESILSRGNGRSLLVTTQLLHNSFFINGLTQKEVEFSLKLKEVSTP